MGTPLFGIDISGLVAQHIGPGVLPALITKPARGARQPGNLTGGKAALPSEQFECRGFWDDFKGLAPPGVTVLMGDRKAVLIGDTIPEGATPGHGWQITIAGQTLYVEAQIGEDPASAVLTFQCRDRLGPDKV